MTDNSAEMIDLRAEQKMSNRLMMRFSGLLGLTTGIGVVAWGAWSMLATFVMTLYERTGLTEVEVLIEDSLNQGLLQSAMLMALGAIILELRRLTHALSKARTDD